MPSQECEAVAAMDLMEEVAFNPADELIAKINIWNGVLAFLSSKYTQLGSLRLESHRRHQHIQAVVHSHSNSVLP